MKKIGLFLISATIILAIISVALWLLWIFIQNIEAASSSVKASLIGILGVLIAGIITQYYTKKREVNARHYEDQRRVYMQLIDLIYSMAHENKSGKKPTNKGIESKMIDLSKALMIWGGPEMIKAWNNYRSDSAKSKSPEEGLKKMELILKTIRKDLGHDDSSLNDFDIIGLMLTADAQKELVGEKK